MNPLQKFSDVLLSPESVLRLHFDGCKSGIELDAYVVAWSLDFTRNRYWSVVRGSEPSQLRFSEDMNRDICDYLALIVGS